MGVSEIMGVWSSRASVQLLGSCFRTRTVTQDKMHPPASELVAMTDAFEGIDRLAEGVEGTEGAPNLRRLPGFPLFGTSQPTIGGFEKILEKVLAKYGDEKHVFWVNLRQEPVVYVNKAPFTGRDPKHLNEQVQVDPSEPVANLHLEINNPEDCTKLENEFAEAIKGRGEDFKYFQDQYGEHPDERSEGNVEKSVKLEGVTAMNEIYGAIKEKVPKVEPIRIPINQEQSPTEENFDQIVALLKDTSASVPVVFNCQAGISRTTTGIIMAGLVKEQQLTRELDQMRGIVPEDILNALKKKKLGLPGVDVEVVNEIIEIYGEPARIAKCQVDKLIDMAAPPPLGNGVENIREVIMLNKMTFDISSDDWQAYLRKKIMGNIERYVYLIVFAMYVREQGPKKYPITFRQYMDAHPDLRPMIEEGKSKIEWERKIPEEKLDALRDMLNADDFKKNIGPVIQRIYQLAFDMFSDLPRGHHKTNAMHKMASKTMIEILPADITAHIEKKCGSLSNAEFYDVVGNMSWFEK